jgi:hypothetical protein
MQLGASSALFVWLISHQPTVLFSHNKPATSNQPAVLFSQNESAPAISQTNRLKNSSGAGHVGLGYPHSSYSIFIS